MTMESSRRQLLAANPLLGQFDQILLTATLLMQSRRDLTVDELSEDVLEIRGNLPGDVPLESVLNYLDVIGVASELDGQWRWCRFESDTHAVVNALTSPLR